MTAGRRKLMVVAMLVGMVFANAEYVAARPLPLGTSSTTVSYPTEGGGAASLPTSIDYTGESPADTIPLANLPNVRSFNSVNSFGRRMFVFNTGPQFSDVLGDDESQIANAFFKVDNGGDFFPGITEGGDITIQVSGATYDQPVTVDPSTVMLHTLWRDDQVSTLSRQYVNLHNHHTDTDPFREFSSFTTTAVFSSFPVPNYVLDAPGLEVSVDGNGTNQLNITATFSYDLLRNLEELGQAVPDGMPGPQGFLEPFHFHLEYVVVPEPATMAMLLPGAAFLMRRRKARREGFHRD